MNRPTLKLSPGVTPRNEESNAKSDDAQAWSEYKHEHHAAKTPSKRRKGTLFLRRRIREENRNKHYAQHNRADEVPFVKKTSKKSQQDRLHKATLGESLGKDSLDALMNLKKELAPSPA